MFAVATATRPSTVFIEFYPYLHDVCVFFCVCFAVCFYVFYVYMGQVPEIKLMMMMTTLCTDSDRHSLQVQLWLCDGKR